MVGKIVEKRVRSEIVGEVPACRTAYALGELRMEVKTAKVGSESQGWVYYSRRYEPEDGSPGAFIGEGAFVDPTVRTHKSAVVGPGSTVLKGCVLGPGVLIMNSTVDEGSRLGEDAQVFNSAIGKNAKIGVGVRIDGDDSDEKGPASQSKMVIEDDVEIGDGSELYDIARISKQAKIGKDVSIRGQGKGVFVGVGADVGPFFVLHEGVRLKDGVKLVNTTGKSLAVPSGAVIDPEITR